MNSIRMMIGALALLACAAGAGAIPYIPAPQPVEEAPIDRALANIAADESAEPALRERMLGRLNLLAYLRDDGAFVYLKENGLLNEAGAVPCAEAPRGMRGQPNDPEPTYGPNDMCARWTFDLGPMNEIPEGEAPAETRPAALARLEAARDHYAAALALEPENLRALLGSAYALDRLGARDAARERLREILRLGLPQLAGPQSEWETHAVLTEAATHLAMLAESRRDRRHFSALRKRLQASQPMIYVTPIVVPLADAPFADLSDTTSDVAFDFVGTGDRRAQGWLKDNAAWLVWDPRGRGEIASGFDMIGSATWAGFWRDGFQVLRALDDDHNGRVDGAELDGLALWRDANGDGVSDAGEVLAVRAHGVVSLATRGGGDRDLLIAREGVAFEDGTVRPLYDWTPRGDDGAKPIS